MNKISAQIIKEAYDHKLNNKEHLLFCTDDRTMYVENTINSYLKRIAMKLDIGIYEEENKNFELYLKNNDIFGINFDSEDKKP